MRHDRLLIAASAAPPEQAAIQAARGGPWEPGIASGGGHASPRRICGKTTYPEIILWARVL